MAEPRRHRVRPRSHERQFAGESTRPRPYQRKIHTLPATPYAAAPTASRASRCIASNGSPAVDRWLGHWPAGCRGLRTSPPQVWMRKATPMKPREPSGAFFATVPATSTSMVPWRNVTWMALRQPARRRHLSPLLSGPGCPCNSSDSAVTCTVQDAQGQSAVHTHTLSLQREHETALKKAC